MPSNPYRAITTGLSTSAGYPTYVPDTGIRPFNIGIGCVVNSTSVTYSVEHTFDPIAFPIYGSSVGTIASSAATWFGNSGITSKSTNQDGNYAYPVSAIRLNVTSTSTQGAIGASSQPYLVLATLIQAG